jgi:hypothetical protein
MSQAAAFAVMSIGLVGLWLYIANAGAREPEPTRIRIDSTAESFPAQLRTFAATAPVDSAVAGPEPAPAPRSARPSRPDARARDTARRTNPSRTATRSQPARPAPPPSPPRAPVSATGYVTVGSVPQGAIYINGRLMPSNPVYAYPVSAGPVRLRFEASDGNGGIVEREMVVNLGPADTLNLGRVRLERPQ